MQENAEAVRRLYEAFNRRDTATTRELMEHPARREGFDTVVDQSHLWTFRDGKAVRFEWFTDPQRALETMADTSSGTP